MVSETNFLKFAEDCFEDIDSNTLDSLINETNSRALFLQKNSESATQTHYINSDPIVRQFVRSCGRREVIQKLGEKTSKSFRLTPSTRHNSVVIERTKLQEVRENDSTAEASRGKFASLALAGMNLQSIGKYSKRKCTQVLLFSSIKIHLLFLCLICIYI